MLDNFILDKAAVVSYSRDELSNIAASSNHLRDIIKNQPDFNESFLGGSYKRATMVKGVSDVDVYFQYTGMGNPQTALTRLRTCLTNSYPDSDIRQDRPSILVDFNRIPFNITPYKKDFLGGLGIPSVNLSTWQNINFGTLEASIAILRDRNSKYIDLIKILKLWNSNYNRGLRNFVIEQNICNLYLYAVGVSSGISDWLWSFYNNYGFSKDAQKIFTLMKSNYSESTLKTEWLKFIDNK